MIVLMVWDGLRPDMIDAQRTPFLCQMASEGVFCQASHAVFPTVTRVNSASLATGCYPGRHGIVDNELYVPAIDPRRPVSCGNWEVLQTMADLEHGRVVEAPTVGEILQASGKKMGWFVSCWASPGSALSWCVTTCSKRVPRPCPRALCVVPIAARQTSCLPSSGRLPRTTMACQAVW